MLKLTFCLRRKPGLSREEFQRYWRENHGPLMRKNMAAMGVRKYVQQRTLEGEAADFIANSRGGPEPFDGVAEVWWDDMAAFESATGSADGRAAGKEMYKDELNFIDLTNSPCFLTEEQFVAEDD